MRRTDDKIELTKEQRKSASKLIKEYIAEHFETEIGGLQADIFLDYITEHIGGLYYNHAVADVMKEMHDRVDDLFLLMKDSE
jgi:uncharacterized protein (DUF2164 family)